MGINVAVNTYPSGTGEGYEAKITYLSKPVPKEDLGNFGRFFLESAILRLSSRTIGGVS